MEQSDKYLLHCSGLYSMLVWLQEQQSQGLTCNVNSQIIYTHPLVGRFFSLGISRKKYFSKEPFLAVQPNENKWFSLIQWEKICVKERDLHIYFISEMVKGNNVDYPDIPPFIFAISFDSMDKIKILDKIEELDAREYRMNELGDITINFHSKIFTLPIEHKRYDQEIADFTTTYVTYNDLMRQKETYLQGHYTSGAPVFEGDTSLASSTITDRKGYLEKLKERWHKYS